MAIKNTKLTPLLSSGTGITLTSNGQIITINSTGAGALPAGSDTQVQFNDAGALGADSTFNKTLNVLGLESIDFAVTPTAGTAERRLLWDNDEGSLNLTLKGGAVDIALGAEVAIMCYNAEATTLNKGEVVYLWSAQGQRPAVKRASNSAESTSSKTFGMVAESIASGANGFVMQMGIVRNVDTNAYTEGDTLYLGSTAGTITTTKPSAPSHMVFVGVILKKSATAGRIFVKPTNGFEVEELHNAAISSVANNDFFVYESSTSLWKNKSISTVLGYTPEQPLTFSSPLSRSVNTVSIPVATSSANGYLSSTDWSTFSGKQNALSGTGVVKSTSGTISYISGTASQFIKGDGSLDSSSYLTGASSVSFSTDVNTIGSQTLGNSISVKVVGLNATALPTLSTTAGVLKWTGATGTWVLDSNTYLTSAITSLNGLTAGTQTFAVGTSGTDFAISSATSTHTFNLPTASATNRGALSSSDWTTFNNKQSTITLTTTGSSGASTFTSNTLNIPNYTLAGLGGFANPMTTLGDVIYGGASGVATRLAGNTTTTKQFLSQTGTGTISAIPAWSAVSKSDVGLGSVENTALSTWAGSTNITTLGTIATGTWSASTISVDKGGTGATTLTGILVGSGTSAITAVAGTASQLLRRNAGNTAYEFFTASYLTSAITSLGGLTASTQTFANDTNVTITSATSTHTLGWSGQLAVSRGGTGLSALGTALQLIRVNSGATALEYFTPTYVTSAITSLNSQTGATQTFANDTNVTITSATNTHTIGWSGQLSIARGGTGQTTATAAFDALSPTTTLGDIIYHNGTDNVRLAGNTTTAKAFLSQTGTGTISAIPTWASITGSDVTGAALTKTDDTNVTLTLGGTPSTSLLRATSLTLGWTGQLAVSRGGTGLSALGTANQLIRVNAGATALEFFTPTYVTSAITSLGGLTASTQTFANDTNVTITSATSTHTLGWSGQLAISRGGTGTGTAPTQYGVIYASTTSAYGSTGAGSTGNVLVSTTSAAPSWATLDMTYIPDAVFKKSARVATTGSNITLSGGAPNTLDGVTLALNDRILVKDQTATGQNGIYYVSTLGTGANGTWTRVTDADTISEIGGAVINVDSGTANGGKLYKTFIKTTDTLGTTSMPFYEVVTSLTSLSNPMTTQGDIIYGGSLGATTRLGIGTASQLLRVNASATAPEWFTPSYLTSAVVSLGGLTAGTQTFANDTNVTITSASSTHTLGWTGQLSVARGGTGLSSLGTSLQVLRVNSAGTALEYATLSGSGITSLNGLTASTQTFTNDTNVTITSTTSAHAIGWSGSLAVGRGGTGTTTTFTTGSVIFAGASGVYSQDNADFFWDATNNRLALGHTSPTTRFHIAGSTTASTGTAKTFINSSTLVAAANNDVLIAQEIAPTFTLGAFTGVSSIALKITTGALNIADQNIILSATTGTRIGTATTQKLSFWNKTPVAQPTTAIAASGRVAGAGTNITTTDTFAGYTIQQIVNALVTTGILA